MRQAAEAETAFESRLWDESEPDGTNGGPLAVPRAADQLARHYDLTISRPRADMEAFHAFDYWLEEAVRERNLRCGILTDAVVRDAIDRLRTGRMTVGFHLDYFSLWHVPHDPYANLALAVRDSGGLTVNPPSRARLFTNKAEAHSRLADQGLGVPRTVLVEPGRDLNPAALDAAELVCDGTRTCYVKPANGFGNSAVTRIEQASFERLRDAVAQVRLQHPEDTVLVQEEIVCPRLRPDDGAERMAYWRLVYCLGEIIPFWWWKPEADHGRPSYRRLAGAEIKRLGLQDVIGYCQQLAELCQLKWFSTEICASAGDEASDFRLPTGDGRSLPIVAIDYVNDQCDVDVQSRWPGGPPDEFVRHVAHRFAETALARRNCLPMPLAAPRRRRAA
jgi:hypothetical protein